MWPRFRRAGVADMPLRRIPFVALLGADAISLNGNALAQLALPWFVLETTGSVAQTGLTAFAGLLPTVLAAFLGGAAVDRLGHKRASVVADVASLLAVALIPLLHARGLLPFWLFLLLVFLGALLDAPGTAARAALFPETAHRAGVRPERANAVHEVVESGAGLTGPLLAGVLIAWLGPSHVLWLDAASFAVSGLLVAVAVPPTGKTPAAPDARAGPGETYLAELAAGLRFIFGDRPIRSIFVSATVLNFALSPLLAVVLPVQMKTVYDSAPGLGLVVAAFGGGSVAGAIVYGAVGHRRPRRGTFVVGVTAIGAALAVLAALPPVPVMAGAMLLGGGIAGPNGPLVATVLQERTPTALRGRVFGATTGVGFAAAPLGVLLAGALLPAVGVQAILIGMAIVALGVAVALAVDGGVREMDRSPRSPIE